MSGLLHELDFPQCSGLNLLVRVCDTGQANKLDIDGARFAKLCRETGLQGGKLNSIAIDIIFSKVKAKVRPTHGILHQPTCCLMACSISMSLGLKTDATIFSSSSP